MLCHLGASPGAYETLMRMNHEIDVRAILPTIRVPTLEVAREGDPIPPPNGYTAKLIPGCTRGATRSGPLPVGW